MGKIIDSGRRLPKARMTDLFELWENREKLVVKPVKKLSRSRGDILYGRHAVNELTGVRRETYDFDVYSSYPKRHAVKIERSIDRGTNSNLAYVEPMTYKTDGKSKKVWRVKVRPHETVECDYQAKPKGLRFKVKKGVRYETVKNADRKYNKMIREGDLHRMPNAWFDRYDTSNYLNRFRRRRKI